MQVWVVMSEGEADDAVALLLGREQHHVIAAFVAVFQQFRDSFGVVPLSGERRAEEGLDLGRLAAVGVADSIEDAAEANHGASACSNSRGGLTGGDSEGWDARAEPAPRTVFGAVGDGMTGPGRPLYFMRPGMRRR